MTAVDAASPAERPAAPIAEKRPVDRVVHGDRFVDDYEWLRDKESPEVLAHLETENRYTEAVTVDQQSLRDAIFAEIQGRTQETDVSLPSRRGDWWYFTRTVEGGAYSVHCRVPVQPGRTAEEEWTPPALQTEHAHPAEEVLLDANAEAAEHEFYDLGGFAVSKNGKWLAWSVDTEGDERYTLQVRDLETGELLPDRITDMAAGLEFLPDDETLLYALVDDAWRPDRLCTHRIGTDPSEDAVLHRDDDSEFWLDAEVSANERWLIASSGNSECSEVAVRPLVPGTGLPDEAFTVLVPRSARSLYEVEPVVIDGADAFAVLHHDRSRNGELALVRIDDVVSATERGGAATLADLAPTTLIAGSDEVRLSGVADAGEVLVVESLQEGASAVSILALADLDAAPVPVLPRSSMQSVSADVQELGSPFLRLSIEEWTAPRRIVEIPVHGLGAGLAPIVRRTTPVPGFTANDYVAERRWAPASDGARVPVTVLRHRDVALDGTAPAIVYGYGSYEASMEPFLALSWISALDRGIVYVVAHVRGGGELGRQWYEHGKKLEKPNTFTDFIAVVDHLVGSRLVDPARIAATGGSAGGLLMGAIANLAPEKFQAIAAIVPFVDPLTSILDPDLPLSALEWEEWGNPITDAEVYACMRAYSPYENIRAVDYPAIAAVTSLNDTRVLYVEPAKWVARLREVTTGAAPILLKTEMAGGHGGGSGRYSRWKDQAWTNAFLATALDATERLTAFGDHA